MTELCKCLHQLTKERPDCGVDPFYSKYVGQCNSEGVLCAGLQSHDVEEIVIPRNLVGRVEGAVNEDTDTYGVIWVGAKLSCTPAQHTGMLAVLSSAGGAVVIGGTSWCVVVRRESECRQLTVAHNCN